MIDIKYWQLEQINGGSSRQIFKNYGGHVKGCFVVTEIGDPCNGNMLYDKV